MHDHLAYLLLPNSLVSYQFVAGLLNPGRHLLLQTDHHIDSTKLLLLLSRFEFEIFSQTTSLGQIFPSTKPMLIVFCLRLHFYIVAEIRPFRKGTFSKFLPFHYMVLVFLGLLGVLLV